MNNKKIKYNESLNKTKNGKVFWKELSDKNNKTIYEEDNHYFDEIKFCI